MEVAYLTKLDTLPHPMVYRQDGNWQKGTSCLIDSGYNMLIYWQYIDHSTVEVAYLTKLDTLPHSMVYTIQARRF